MGQDQSKLRRTKANACNSRENSCHRSFRRAHSGNIPPVFVGSAAQLEGRSSATDRVLDQFENELEEFENIRRAILSRRKGRGCVKGFTFSLVTRFYKPDDPKTRYISVRTREDKWSAPPSVDTVGGCERTIFHSMCVGDSGEV
ncbi:hypothetical protein AAMO2058_001382100 [Amorphochlora amoebiformis]